MSKLNVAVVFGGYSSEHEISKKSVITVLSNMSEAKYNTIPIYIDKDGKWLLYDGSITNIKNVDWNKFGTSVMLSLDRDKKCIIRIVGDKIKNIPIDVIFPVLHGKNGEDGTIQGLFEISGIPYVGCDVLSSAISMDKLYTKIIVDSINIEQTEYLCFKKEDLNNLDEVCKNIRYKIGYPCFIKPSRGGSSVGISKANNKKDLINSINKALEEDNKVIIEKCIDMRELECAILGSNKNNLKISRVGEVKSAEKFYDFDSKYNNSKSYTIVPADIPKEIEDNIREKAAKIFNILGCIGLSRLDFFLENGTNRVIFNEINTMPGFTDISMYPMLLKENGYEISDIIDELIAIAINKL